MKTAKNKHDHEQGIGELTRQSEVAFFSFLPYLLRGVFGQNAINRKGMYPGLFNAKSAEAREKETQSFLGFASVFLSWRLP